MINNGSNSRPGWFNNPGWEVTYDAAEARRRFFIYEAWHEEEKERLRLEREAANLERQKLYQSQVPCFDSGQCASGFACVNGRCQYIDPTGATGDGGEAGCGAAPGGSGGGGGNGGGCGGSGATGGGSGGSSSSIQSCTTSSAGICPGSFRPDDGDGGGGGGGPCGDTCCRCGTSGCGCIKGKCPDPPNTCSRFCQEVEVIGGSVMKCRAKRCEDFCQRCEDINDEPTCVPDRLQEQTDCRCGHLCPECDFCSFSGNCLSRNCPPPEEPPEEPPADRCEPKCRTFHSCVQVNGVMECSEGEECDDLPPDCEPCDCDCNDECPECMICNTGTGKCQQDPSCNGCQPDTLYWTVSDAVTRYYVKTSTNACTFSEQKVKLAGATSGSFTTSCGPLTATLVQSPIQVPTNINQVYATNSPTSGACEGWFYGSVQQEQHGIWNVHDGNGDFKGQVFFGYATVSSLSNSIVNSTATPSIVTFNR